MAENQKHKSNITKRPSVVNLCPKLTSAIQMTKSASKSAGRSENCKLPTPKTRFNSQTKSSEFQTVSSSRLKSFPAEEIRKIKISPRQPAQSTPSVVENISTNSQKHGGQGDTFSPPLAPGIVHQNHSMSQQYVPPTFPSQKTYSVPVISPTLQHPAYVQLHRPFVPVPTYTEVPKIAQELPYSVNKPWHDVQKPTDIRFHPNHRPGTPKDSLQKLECEKQPVGGRNAALHRLEHETPRGNNIQPEIPPISYHYGHPYPATNFPQHNLHMGTNCYQHPAANQPVVYCPMYAKNPYDQFYNQSMVYHGYPVGPSQLMYPGNHQLTFDEPPRPSSHPYHHCQHPRPRKIQRERAQEPQYPEFPPLRSSNSGKLCNESKKNNCFTPAMIRDQELLMKTMRQQGVNQEIMKCQFEALLNEQRRQLAYEKQLEQTEEIIQNTNQQCVIKIEDGKPEWMERITPRRIPYALAAEMMSKQKEKESRKNVTFRENNCQQYQNTSGNKNSNHENTIYKPHPTSQQQQITDAAFQQDKKNSCICNDPQNCALNQQRAREMRENSRSIPYRNEESKQKQKNGLQDMKTMLECMEDLKNNDSPPNLGSLANLNPKKQEIHLNGIQDADDSVMQALSNKPERPEVEKRVSANGLENQRNANNPLPQPTQHQKHFEEFHREYPKRKNFRAPDEIVPAERDRETNSNIYQCSPAFQNSEFGPASYKNPPHQAHQGCVQAEGRVPAYTSVTSNSLPCDMIQQSPGRIITSPASKENKLTNPPNHHQTSSPENPCCANSELLEPRIIGGIKYYARRSICPGNPGCEDPGSTTPVAFH